MSGGNDVAILRSIERYLGVALARGAKALAVGGFTGFFWPLPDPFYRNAALPLPAWDEPAPPPDALVAAFAAHGLRTRIELLEELHPQTASCLRDAGFHEVRMPAMVLECWPAGPPPTVEFLDPASGEAVIGQHLRELDLGMGGEGMMVPGEARNLLRDIAQGRSSVAIRREAGRMVGSATLVREGDVAELLAVWTDPAWRCRGIARRLCSTLLADWLAIPGRLVWLGAGSEPARLLYRDLGFRTVGTHVAFVRAH